MSPIMSSASLSIPLTFQKEKTNLLELSCSRARPSVIRSWGNVPNSQPEPDAIGLEGGCAIGTDDGSLFLFKQTPKPQQSTRISSILTPPESHSPSRSSTPTSPLPFNLNQRSRVVSGITTEQVEAPKNYVDFDDEPDKLKDILQGRPPRESRDKPVTPAESSRPGTLKGSPTPSITGISYTKRPKSLLSVMTPPNATASSSHSSTPRDPALESPDLRLWCHVILPKKGLGTAVTGIRLIEDYHLLVVLQETGDLSVISIEDGSCVATTDTSNKSFYPPAGIEDKDAFQTLWLWNHIEVYEYGELTLIVTAATVNPNSPSPATLDPTDNGVLEKSRLSIFELHSRNQYAPLDARIEKVGQWHFDGPSYSVGLHRELDDSLKIFNLSDGHLLCRGIHLLPRERSQSESQPHEKNGPNIGIPNPFKAFKAQSAEHISTAKDLKVPGRIGCDVIHELGEVLPGESILGLRAWDVGRRTRLLVWSEQHLTILEYQGEVMHVLCMESLALIEDAQWTTDSSYTVLFEDRAECYALSAVDADNNNVSLDLVGSELRTIVTSQLLHTFTKRQHDVSDITRPLQILTTSCSENGDRCLTVHDISTNDSPRTFWQASSSSPGSSSPPEITSLLPLGPDVIVQGRADGRLQNSTLIQLIEHGKYLPSSDSGQELALNGFVTSLHIVSNGRTKERFIIGGADDGSIAFWTLDNYKICARWTVFTTCLSRVIQIPDTQQSTLKGCVLCVSADGAIAVIAIDGFQYLYLVPGASAPLHRVCIGSNNLLLVYADNRARLWDTKTQEFWRSMNQDKVGDLLEQGGWTDIGLDRPKLQDTALTVISNLSFPDTSSTLLLDLDRFTTESITIAKTISTNRDQTRAILSTLERLRSVLSVLLTPGLNHDIDNICSTKLGIRPAQASTGFARNGTVTLFRKFDPREVWCMSSDVTAARALSITVLLGALGVFEELMEGVNTVMIFYATSLSSVVGKKYKPPSLAYLALRWFDGSPDIRRSTRVLFDYAVACLSDEESSQLSDHWHHRLPCLQPPGDRELPQAALALFLCGYLAAEKYSLLSVSALTDISKSIALYLHDEQSLHRVLAVDLCSRGFHIWQHYIDAMEILRALFSLATSTRKDSITLQNVGAQARLAVLQIASSNTALFMTTLGLDILTPPTLEHRKAVMQIVAFLIRKRPLVLQPNIPKLMEAVVRSLDPNLTTHREAVLDSATEIIGHVVKKFPTVDFHMGTQRLAVGSTEGAVIMYDLNTAIRLYVLEGHKKTISACSFSPDGRRLLSLSIEENVALVWKVGTSFASFFNPGAPPSQGHGNSQPFKTISFNVGDAANMNVQQEMELIHITWIADRSVKIAIRDSVLTFST